MFQVLDYQLKPIVTLNRFKSMLWIERFSSAGEFTLELDLNTLKSYNENYFRPSDQLMYYITDGHSVMMIENFDIPSPKKANPMVKISGRDILAFLNFRDMRMGGTDSNSETIYSRVPSQLICDLVSMFAINSSAGAVNILPLLSVQDMVYPTRPSQSIRVQHRNIYEAITELADSYNYGVSVMLNINSVTKARSLLFYTYNGTGQLTLRPEDYYIDQSEFFSTTTFANHARVRGKTMGVDVYDSSSIPSGWDRRTAVYDLSNVANNTNNVLTNAGKNELLRNRRSTQQIEGVIPNDVWEKFPVTQLGDTVYIRNHDQRVRLTEIATTYERGSRKIVPTFEPVKYVG